MSIPIVSHVLSKIADSIEQTLLPDLGTDYARQQAQSAVFLLRVLAPIVQPSQTMLAEENVEMRNVLGRILTSVDLKGASVRHRAQFFHEVKDKFEGISGDESDVSANNLALKRILSDVISNLDLLRDFMSARDFVAIETELHVLLRKQIDGKVSHWSGLAAAAKEQPHG